MSNEDKRRKSKELNINFTKHTKDKVHRQRWYNTYVDEIIALENPEKRLELLRKTEEQLLNDGITFKISKAFKEDKIGVVRSAIKRTEEEIDSNVKAGGRDVQKIIDEISNRISSKKSGGWKAETISGFLTAYNKNNDASVSDLREIAIENAIDENIKGELAEVPQSTLYDWREKLDD
jgi:hypothetical protein